MIGTEVITGFATKIVSQPVSTLWIVLGVAAALIIFYILRQFFDIIVDMWKLPFAVLLDAVDTLAYNNPYLDVAACVGNIVLFWALAKRGDHIGKVFGLIAAIEAIIGIWIFPQYAYITNLVPTSTILTIITIWAA